MKKHLKAEGTQECGKRQAGGRLLSGGLGLGAAFLPLDFFLPGLVNLLFGELNLFIHQASRIKKTPELKKRGSWPEWGEI